MKALLVLLLFVAPLHGQILIYKTTVSRTAIGYGFTTKRSIPGYLVIDVPSGLAVEFALELKTRAFLNRTNAFTVRTLDAGGGKSYSVFTESKSSTNSTGHSYTAFFIVKGVNLPLDIGWAGNQLVPRTMRSMQHAVDNLAIAPFLSESAGSLSLDLASTKSANASGQSLTDVAASIRSSLFARGFQDAHP